MLKIQKETIINLTVEQLSWAQGGAVVKPASEDSADCGFPVGWRH